MTSAQSLSNCKRESDIQYDKLLNTTTAAFSPARSQANDLDLFILNGNAPWSARGIPRAAEPARGAGRPWLWCSAISPVFL